MLSFGPKVWVVTLVTVAAAYIGVVGWSARLLPLPLELHFSKAMPRPVSLSGFSSAEPWGRWSASKEASVSFMGRLPGSFSLNPHRESLWTQHQRTDWRHGWRRVPGVTSIGRAGTARDLLRGDRRLSKRSLHGSSPDKPARAPGRRPIRVYLGLGIASMEIVPLSGR